MFFKHLVVIAKPDNYRQASFTVSPQFFVDAFNHLFQDNAGFASARAEAIDIMA